MPWIKHQFCFCFVFILFWDWRFDLSDDVESRLQTMCFNPAKSIVLIYVTAVSEWVSEWINVVKSVRTAAHTERERERKTSLDMEVLIGKAKSLEFQWPITRTESLTQQKSMISLDNCPIWIQIGFVLFWYSSQVYDYSSTVVIVFVCEWMCVLVQFFTRKGLTGEGAKCVCVCVCERERERESHVILCSTLQLQHDGIWPQPTRTMPSSSTFLSWSAFISIRSFTSHMMSLLNLWMHLPLPQHPLWFLLLFFYYPKKKEK
jgi:hypothetical protein